MAAPPDLIVTLNDALRAGICARGTKAWFAANGLDFRSFLENGIPASELPEDANALKAIEAAKARQ